MTPLPPGFRLDDEDPALAQAASSLPDGFKVDEPEPESRKAAMLLNGLTFGLAPRIKAAWETGDFSGPEYEAAKQREWAKDDAYRKANPWTATALEIGGSIPTMFIPGLGAGRLAQAAGRAGNVATNLSRGQRMARALGVGRNVGSVGHEAGMLGAKTAAAYGSGSSREDTIGGRLGEGLTHAPLGYGLGRVGDALMRPLVGSGEYLYDAARVGGNAELGALTSLRRGMERDRGTTQAIRDTIMPDMGRMQQVNPRSVETAISTYGTAIEQGATDAAARSAARQAYIAAARQSGSTVADSTLNQQANRAIERYAPQMEIPLAFDELARLSGGTSGQNLQWTRRAAANSPGEGRERLFSTVTGRQEDIIPTVRARVEDTLGDADWLAAKDRLVQANRAIEDQLYGAAKATEQPFDLSRVLDEFNRTQAFASGKTRKMTEDALQTMRGIPDANGNYQRHTIDTYIQARGELNDLIEESMKVNPVTGSSRPTSTTRQLMQLKERLDRVVAEANSGWRQANDLTRNMRSIEGAMDDGMRVKLAGKDNTSARVVRRVEQLRNREAELTRMANRTPDQNAELALVRNQIEAHQTGFARTMHEQLNAMGDTHTVAKAFLKGGRGARSGPRRTLEVMMGRRNAEAFLDQMERANIASTTYKNQFNSQTTPLAQAMADEDAQGRIAGLIQAGSLLTSPLRMVERVGDRIGARLNEARNAELARRLTATTETPADLFRLLQELDDLALQRGAAFSGERINAYSAPGIASGAFGANIQSQQSAREKELRRTRGY